MTDWMQVLARRYEGARTQYGGERLMILFDIDGTILDMRYAILHILNRYDATHQTGYFVDIGVEDVDVHEERVDDLLTRLRVPQQERAGILRWFEGMLWETATNIEVHEPFPGVYDVIRWFQNQPGTAVGLNTGRPEILREATLFTVNHLGRHHGVFFPDSLLFMRPPRFDGNIRSGKVEGVRHFRSLGFRVFAMVDNEPENLQAIADEDPGHEVLLLHADTIFKSPLHMAPSRSIKGKIYDLARLRDEWERFRRVLKGHGPGLSLPLGESAAS